MGHGIAHFQAVAARLESQGLPDPYEERAKQARLHPVHGRVVGVYRGGSQVIAIGRRDISGSRRKPQAGSGARAGRHGQDRRRLRLSHAQHLLDGLCGRLSDEDHPVAVEIAQIVRANRQRMMRVLWRAYEIASPQQGGQS